jgi:hypothetical protein
MALSNHVISIFIREVENQSRYALIAIEKLRNNLKKIDHYYEGINKLIREKSPSEALDDYKKNNNPQKYWDSVFIYAHSFLNHSANLSKLFFPSDRTRRRTENAVFRSDILQKIFLVSESSPIRHRHLRDHLEHFDERLDEWASSSQSKTFVDSNIVSNEKQINVNQRDDLRNFITESFSMFFQGTKYELLPIESEIKRILPIAEEAFWDYSFDHPKDSYSNEAKEK